MTLPIPTRETPLSHYLLYWWLDEGFLVNVDGSMALAWEVDAIDPSCLPSFDLNQKAAQLRRLVNALPPGYHLQWLRRSRRLDEHYFHEYLALNRATDPLFEEQRALSAEALRARGLRRFETYAVLIKPRALGKFGAPGTDRLTRLVNHVMNRQDPLGVTLAQHEAARCELTATADSVQQILTATGATLRRLDGVRFLRLIYTFINPSATPDSVPPLEDVLPRDPAGSPAIYADLSLREQVLRTAASWDLDMISLDDPLRPHRVLAMKSLPRVTRTDLAMGFKKIEQDHWLAIGITAIDTSAREAKIERRRNRAFSSARGRYTRNVKADAEYEELETALDQMARRDQQLFELTVHVLLGADNVVDLDQATRTTIDAVRLATKVHLETATYAQFHGWLGMMPGAGHSAPHRRVLLTDNVADFIPIYASAQGARHPLFLLSHRSGEPYFLDITDPRKDNHNFNVLGSSGKGKSFLMSGLIASSILGQRSPLIIIDVGGRDDHGNVIGSYYRLCQLAGGEYFEFSLDGANAVNPFMSRDDLYLDEYGQPSPKPDKLKLKFLTGIVEMLVREEGQETLTTVEQGIIRSAIMQAYDRWGADRPPLLEDLIPELANFPGDREDTATAKGYAKTIQAWVSGPHGALLNSPSRIQPRTPFTVFDMKGLEQLGRLAPVVMMILTSYVWSLISRPRNGLAWVIYDECWKLLNDPTAGKLHEELYRTARKLKAGVGSVTQRIEDFLAAPSSQAALANAEASYLLGHRTHHETVAKLLSLNSREFELFKSLETRKGFFSEFLLKPAGDSLDPPAVLRYYAGPLDYWMNTTDPLDRDLEREVLENVNGDRAAALRRLASDFPNGAVAGGYERKEAAA